MTIADRMLTLVRDGRSMLDGRRTTAKRTWGRLRRVESPTDGIPATYLWIGAAALGAAAVALWWPSRRALAHCVEDVMVRDVLTVDPDATLMDAARMMRDANVGILPVVGSDRRVHGVITDRDIVIRAIARGIDPRTVHVTDCASRALTCARPEWSVDRAMEVMSESRVGRLPVIDDQDRLVGILTLGSLALRAGEDDETLETARDVSRRAARIA